VLIGAATLLGLIVVLHNWRYTEAKLLIWTIKLPFILWAMIFMLVGYFTGKWIEWAIQQRRIRKGTYKPRRTAEELADASANLEGRLDKPDEPGAASDDDEPATIIDRGESRPRPGAQDGPVEQVDYWEEPKEPAEGDEHTPPPGKFSPAAQSAAGESGGKSREGSGDRGYREYRDYGDSGGGRYDDYGDSGGGGRYGDYSDSGGGGRYGDYSDSGGGGRYGDYGDSGGGGRYGDYGDYQDGGGRRGGRRR
jgi:uncharacterized membrane protein YgcG